MGTEDMGNPTGIAKRDSKGRLLPGHSMGRPPSPIGRANKVTRTILSKALSGFLTDEALTKDLESLEPKERLDTLSKLMPYVLPRLSAVEIFKAPDMQELLLMEPDERAKRIQQLREEIRLKREEAVARGAIIETEGHDD